MKLYTQCIEYSLTQSYPSLFGISFADSNNGMIGSSSNVIYRTTDGGKTWKSYVNPLTSNAIYKVAMVDSMVAFVVTFIGEVFYTKNGGITWQPKGQPVDWGQAISFIDSNHGAVAGCHIISVTSDGGDNWYSTTLSSASCLQDVGFFDSNHLIIVSANDTIFRSSDGGKSWIHQYIFMGRALKRISITDSNTATAVGYAAIMRTTDGGNHWQTQWWDYSNRVSSVSFLDTKRGVVYGDSTLLSTLDGGLTWTLHRVSPNRNCNVAFLNSGTIIISGEISDDGGNSFLYRIGRIVKGNCPLIISSVSPSNGALNVPLDQNISLPRSHVVSWNINTAVIIAQPRIQLSADSNFSQLILIDTTLSSHIIVDTSVRVGLFIPTTTYYWHVSLKYVDGTQTTWSDVWRFTTAGGIISGYVFSDINRDSIRNPSEPGLSQWPVNISGKISAQLYPDSNGQYSFAGLDSGQYIISNKVFPLWIQSCSTLVNTVKLGLNEKLADVNFGWYHSWNSISGKVFHDINENGVQDINEPGLEKWLVQLSSASGIDSVFTDTQGNYCFGYLSMGGYGVNVMMHPLWEQIIPQFQKGYSFIFYRYNQQMAGFNFGLHAIPLRVKLSLLVHDSLKAKLQNLTWGVREGATYGIWGVDSTSTFIDFSEGETEVPPKFPDGFDARFEDPRRDHQYFGLGSWIDMRNYISSAQADTYKITFSPGIIDGGDYPMTFRWSKDSVQSRYNGSVQLATGGGIAFDMKTNDSLVITDPNITYLYLIAEGPQLTVSSVQNQNQTLPKYFALDQNYPNPFNSNTRITYHLSKRASVKLTVHNILGQQIETLVDNVQSAGDYSVGFNSMGLPSGIYIYRIESVSLDNLSDIFFEVKKLLLLK